jgi:hypothetical protein
MMRGDFARAADLYGGACVREPPDAQGCLQLGTLLAETYPNALGSRQASKVALTHLQRRLQARGYVVHDTQWTTEHLAQFGGHEIPCAEYLDLLARAVRMPVTFG